MAGVLAWSHAKVMVWCVEACLLEWWMNLSLRQPSVADDAIPRAVAHLVTWVLGLLRRLIILGGDSSTSSSLSEDSMLMRLPVPTDAVALVGFALGHEWMRWPTCWSMRPPPGCASNVHVDPVA